MAGRFPDFGNADFPYARVHGRSNGGANEIVEATRTPEFARHAATAIPKDLEVPNESAHPTFLVVDFAICAEENRLVPRLIELQAFPSLFGFQLLVLGCMRKAYPVIPRNWTSSFGGIKDDEYLQLLRRTIIADSAGKMWSCWRSSRKNKKRESISPQQKHFLVFAGLRDENQKARTPIILRSRRT